MLISPPSLDLAAHLFRARLFAVEGFGLWDNWWYSGHDVLGYSVLFPAVSAAVGPQLAAACAAVATAAVFEPLARRHFGDDAWLGAVLFGAATATNLYTGRLAFAFGLLPALGAVAALDRTRTVLACALAAICALCSPVAALFAALACAGVGLAALLRARRVRAVAPAGAVATTALLPVVTIAIAFPEGGREPFALTTLLPVALVIGLGLAATPRRYPALRTGIAVYALATLGAFALSSPVGANIARLGALLAAPLGALLWWPGHGRRLIALIAGLLAFGWADAIRDVAATAGDPATTAAYYAPLNRFLAAQGGPPFRTEIPFTRLHWEADEVAPRFPLARGWERQLDVADNPLFYTGRLTAARYERWLHDNAVRFVAVADVRLDPSARAEAALVARGLPDLRLVARLPHWRVYAVAGATPIVSGPARLTALGPDWLAITARAAGRLVVRVHFSPYWALATGGGCVSPDGDDVQLALRRAGSVRLVMRFALDRIGARSPRCT